MDAEAHNQPAFFTALSYPTPGNGQPLLSQARKAGVAVLYSTGRRHTSLSTLGQWAAKNARAGEDLATSDDREIVAEIAPAPGDLVVEKSRPSAFFGREWVQPISCSARWDAPPGWGSLPLR